MSISGNSPGRAVRTAGFLLLFLCLTAGWVYSQNPFYSGDAPPPKAPAAGSGGSSSAAFVDLQMTFREQAARRLQSLRDDPSVSVLLAFAAAAFVYGVLHGAGPGHRKTVVFSLFLSRRARWYEPAAAGFLSAGVHAGTSVILILLFSLIGGGSVARDTDQAGV
ncbi:MAG: hypothetical protein JW760_11060, partial [Spirochaetales bacterium]|nr:hypothetical protein [Spirochaetales bacterium]